jgi:hypothetical protein
MPHKPHRADLVTPEIVREMLDYDPETGVLKWRVRPSQGVRAGSATGCLREDGYLGVRIRMQTHLAHRLAWLWMTGDWPPSGHEIDHINTNRADNRWGNLRLATRSQNRMNSAGVLGRELPKGVTKAKRGGYVAAIAVSGKMIHIGSFATPKLASAAYERAAKEAFGEFARAA